MEEKTNGNRKTAC